MFALLQLYPLEAFVSFDSQDDDDFGVDVLVVDDSRARLEQFAADYEHRYRTALDEWKAWNDINATGARSTIVSLPSWSTSIAFARQQCRKCAGKSSRYGCQCGRLGNRRHLGDQLRRDGRRSALASARARTGVVAVRCAK
jgi:hypothetical protein